MDGYEFKWHCLGEDEETILWMSSERGNRDMHMKMLMQETLQSLQRIGISRDIESQAIHTFA